MKLPTVRKGWKAIAYAIGHGVAAAAIVHVLGAVVPSTLYDVGARAWTWIETALGVVYYGIQGPALIASCLVDAIPADGTRGVHLCEGATTIRLLSPASPGAQPLGYWMGLGVFAAIQSLLAYLVTSMAPPGTPVARSEQIISACVFAVMYLVVGFALSILALILYTSS